MRENMPEKNVQHLLAAAENGDAEAAFCLGELFLKGIAIPQDPGNAVRMFRMAANAGHASAQHQLGVCCETGVGMGQSYKDAVKWYRMSARNQYISAMISLGRCCEQGLGQAMDLEEAAHWYRCAAYQGDCLGAYQLARMMEAGLGMQRDAGKAAEYYLIAARGGIIAAQVAAGRCFRDGVGVETDPQKAFSWFSAAAEQGNPIAQWNAGTCCELGIGTDVNPEAAAEWYQKAALQEYVPAMRDLGRCLRDGIGGFVDIEKSIALLERATERNDPVAAEELAVCMVLGIGKKKDIPGAAKLYRRVRGGKILNEAQLSEALKSRLKSAECAIRERIENEKLLREHAAKQNEPEALVQENALGSGVAQTEKTSADQTEEHMRKWRSCCEELERLADRCSKAIGSMELVYTRIEGVLHAAETERTAVEQGLKEALLLQKQWEHEQTEDAVRDLRELAAAACVACEQAGKCLTECRAILDRGRDMDAQVQNYPAEAIAGSEPEESDMDEVRWKTRQTLGILERLLQDLEEMERQAAATDAITARLSKIGQLRSEILSGVNAAFEENWVAFGDVSADAALEEANRLIRRKERRKAVAWLHRAAELGNAEARNQLAYLYERGKLLPQNKEEAFRLYQLAAGQGYAVAQYNLAVCFAEGVGTQRDMVQAVEWFRKAAEQGNPEACLELAECYRTGTGVPQDPRQMRYWKIQAKVAER